MRERINNQIRVPKLRVIDNEGKNLGVISTKEALEIALERGLDVIEISPNTDPPIAKIMDYGKFKYQKSKKQKEVRAKSKRTETKSLQIKIGTAPDILHLRAKKVAEWLKEGHRVKLELFLTGRSKYMDREFLKERLDRLLNLITEDYKIAEPHKKTPKGLGVVIEKSSKK